MQSPASPAWSRWPSWTRTSCASCRGCGASPATRAAKPPLRRRRRWRMRCWTRSDPATSTRSAPTCPAPASLHQNAPAKTCIGLAQHAECLSEIWRAVSTGLLRAIAQIGADGGQAVMELGATVCTVHQPPSCAACPLRNICQAYADVQAQPETAPRVTAYPAKVLPQIWRWLDLRSTRAMTAVVHLLGTAVLRWKRLSGERRLWLLPWSR